MRKACLPVWTFLAILLVMTLVGFFAVPSAIQAAQNIYIRLQADYNLRMSKGLAQFVANRARDGISRAQISKEAQAIIANSDVDRGYSCIIDQKTQTYINHPMRSAIGVDISTKRGFFQTDLQDTSEQKWQHVVPQVQSTEGILTS